ncbi:MAG: hypothetical protein IJ060_06875 [Oscillospiraceae bacterium]|nr:hypothetical protein [Oscillospiraceae bacterium]
MRNYGDAECHYDVQNGIVWFTERGKARAIAKFDCDEKAEAYLTCLVCPKSEPKKKTKKTSGKYEQKKAKHRRK